MLTVTDLLTATATSYSRNSPPVTITDTDGTPIGYLTGHHNLTNRTPRWTGDPHTHLTLTAEPDTTTPITIGELLVLLAEIAGNSDHRTTPVLIQLGDTLLTATTFNNNGTITTHQPAASSTGCADDDGSVVTVPARLLHQLTTADQTTASDTLRHIIAELHDTATALPAAAPTPAVVPAPTRAATAAAHSTEGAWPGPSEALSDAIEFVADSYDMYTDEGNQIVESCIVTHVNNIIAGRYPNRTAAVTDLITVLNTLAGERGTHEIYDTEPRCIIAESVNPAYIASGWAPIDGDL
jgi:hypothetical protein